MIKRFHSNVLYAHDLEKTYDFYTLLGFDPQKTDDGVRIKLGDVTLFFIDETKTEIKNESGMKPKGLGIYMYIEVDDVDRHFEFVKKNGVTPRTQPKTWGWGKREFVVKDPDEYKLVFYSPIR